MTVKKVATQPIPSPVVKHFRAVRPPNAVCQHCEWFQREALLAEARIHVRHHPTHVVEVLESKRTLVWAETRDGREWREVYDG